MLPSKHIVIGAVFSVFLYLLGFQLVYVFLFFLSSFLIDVDHYLYYFYRKKDLSLKRAFNWYLALDKRYFALPKNSRGKYWYGFCIFHGIEPIILIFIFSIFFKPLVFVSLGFLLHIALDILLKIFEGGDPLELSSLIYKVYYNSKRKNLELSS